MSKTTTLPHTCPHCGSPFGWGADAPLLAICNNVRFDEPAPCCGGRLVGIVTDGVPEFDQRAPVALAPAGQAVPT